MTLPQSLLAEPRLTLASLSGKPESMEGEKRSENGAWGKPAKTRAECGVREPWEGRAVAGLGSPCPQLPMPPPKCSSAETPGLFHFSALPPDKPQNAVTEKRGGSGASQPENSLLLARAGGREESKPWPGLGLAGTGRALGEQPRMGGWPQPCVPAPASSLGASEVPFPWAQMDAGHYSPGLAMSLWFRDIYLLFIIMGKKCNSR